MVASALATPKSLKTYKCPLYCVTWVSAAGKDGLPSNYLICGGGGGKGNHGVKNMLLISQVGDSDSADGDADAFDQGEPEFVSTGDHAPDHLATHPSQDWVVCATDGDVRVYQVVQKSPASPASTAGEQDSGGANNGDTAAASTATDKMKTGGIALCFDEAKSALLKEFGKLKRIEFSNDGSTLLLGREEPGEVHIREWPSMNKTWSYAIESQAETPAAATADGDSSQPSSAPLPLIDLSMSSNSKLVAATSKKVVHILDAKTGRLSTTLTHPLGLEFKMCQFGGGILAAITNTGGIAQILVWNAATWRVSTKFVIAKDPVTAVGVSSSMGVVESEQDQMPVTRFLSLGTSEGDILVVDGNHVRIHKRLKAAHTFAVSGMAFSADGKLVASCSIDSSARCMEVERGGPSGSTVTTFFRLLVTLVLLILVVMQGWLLYLASTDTDRARVIFGSLYGRLKDLIALLGR